MEPLITAAVIPCLNEEETIGPVVTGGHSHRGPSWVSFTPAAVSLYPTPPGGSPRNAWMATVRSVEITGQTRSRIEDDLSSGRILSADEAREYGLIDTVVGKGERGPS